MKLLFVSNLFPDESESWRGLDNVTLLHALRQQEPGLDIRVLAFRPALGWPGRLPQLKPRAGDEVLLPTYHKAAYIPRFGGLNHRLFGFSLARAWRALEGFQPDAILAPWLFPDACAAACCFPGVPLVAVAQGSDVHQYLRMPMRRRAILSLCCQARAVVTRSQDLRHRLVTAGADAGRVHAVYNGVHPEVFRPASREAAREALGLPLAADERLVLFVGNFLPVKGTDLLLQAFARVAKAGGQPATLALIGSGPLEAAIKQQAAELGIAPRLRFAGRQPPEVVARWMQAANAVCLSSHNEGVPNVVLEAVSSGRPMVSTDVGGIAEILEPLMSRRFLVAGRDPAAYAAALADALDHPPDEQALHQKALQYSWEKCAQKYLALLR